MTSQELVPHILLSWGAGIEESPVYLDGVLVEIETVVKDPAKVEEITRWYDQFYNAEEKMFSDWYDKYIELEGEAKGEELLERTIRDLKDRLVPWGKRLAGEIGAELEVVWGGGELAKQITFKVYGTDDPEVNAYWKKLDEIEKGHYPSSS